MKVNLSSRPVRFLLVGALNTLVSYLVFAGLLWLGLDFIAASITGALVSLVFNYRSISRLVFGDGGGWKKFLGFSAVFATSIALNILGIALLNGMGITKYLAAALTAGPVAVVTYFLNTLVFRR